MSVDDDDKPTVVLDLNALKKQKLKQEEELASIVEDLEFAVPQEEAVASAPAKESSAPKSAPGFRVILFDFQSDFFQKAMANFPRGFEYVVATELADLNRYLAAKTFQIVMFNYDANPKAVNHLSAQVKKKFPATKTLIMAKHISPEKARVHAQTPSGANGYYQLPLDGKKLAAEFQKIQSGVKKAG
jgi:hypothetical protein